MKKIALSLFLLFSFENCGTTLPNISQDIPLVEVGIESYLPLAIDYTFSNSQNKNITYQVWSIVDDSIKNVLLKALAGQSVSVQNLQAWVNALNENALIPDYVVQDVQIVVNFALAYIPTTQLAGVLPADVVSFLVQSFTTADSVIELALQKNIVYKTSSSTPAKATAPEPKTFKLQFKFVSITSK